jgi:hypothetical protein
VWEQDLRVSDPGKPFKVTLSWLDTPAAPNANPTIVNNLDLEVVDGATTYRGNVFSGGFSIAGGSADTVNTIEAVHIQNPASAVLKVRVLATNIPGDGVPGNATATDQDFSLFAWNGSDLSSAGYVAIGRNALNCSTAVPVQVGDLDLIGAANTTVTVTSSTGDSQVITLNAAPLNSGIFSGTLFTGPFAAPVTPDDGILEVADGGTVTATYLDASDGSSPAVATDTVPVDCTAPMLTPVIFTGIGLNTFTATTTSNEPCTVAWQMGLNCGESVQTRETAGTTHRVTFSGLLPCTTYRVGTTATDPAGNGSTSLPSDCAPVTTYTPAAGAFIDNFDPAAQAGWTTQAIAGTNQWQVRPATLSNTAPNVYSLESYTNGQNVRLVSPTVQGGGELQFFHSFATERRFDFLVLEISTDGGTNWQNLGPNIIEGGYNDPEGWNGGSAFGAMTRVRADLSSFTGPVRIGFRFTSDSSITIANGGWRIDSMQVGQIEPCLSPLGRVSTPNAPFSCGEPVAFTVSDSNAIGTSVSVTVSTDTGDEETVAATAVPGSPGLFEGSIPTTTSSPVDGDGQLSVGSDTTVTVRYQDTDTGDGTSQSIEATALADCDLPEILDVEVFGIGATHASVRVTADEAVTAVLAVGGACGTADQTLQSTTPATVHLFELTGLDSSTTYSLGATVTDAAENTATRPCVQFRTTSVPVGLNENFDDLSHEFAPEGLWRLVQTGDSCADAFSAPAAFYFGNMACNYSGNNAGSLTTPVFRVPAVNPVLSFRSREQTEGTGTQWDMRRVFINAGGTRTQIHQSINNANAWYEVQVPLTAYAGETATLEFEFDSVDSFSNNFLGWYVDDILVAGDTEPGDSWTLR